VESFSRSAAPSLLHELLHPVGGPPSRGGWRVVPPLLRVAVQHRVGRLVTCVSRP
jgi:hypothetical protein